VRLTSDKNGAELRIKPRKCGLLLLVSAFES
jgi:hypothetical protein